MRPARFFVSSILINFLILPALAQQNDSTWLGKAKGFTRDSAYNYVLQSASVAIYTAKDTGLITYQLSNHLGEFQFTNLPVNVRLLMRVYYTGYQLFSKQFVIPEGEKSIDLKELNLERSISQLEDVVVTSSTPVRMNGDTLEFNASAFKLDKNAVAEDLLRKLPGITIWSDGSITANGRRVTQVLVEGKPFFGRDARVATQNITKTAIDKIQVYQQSQNINNPLDSITEINIKLKKGKNFGHFGKLSAGYLPSHHDVDFNMNFFNSRTQLGIVAAANNINKIADNANILILNSTYKTNGISGPDYRTNFDLRGYNRFKAAGLVFQHDFIPDPNYYKNNRLSGNYFYSLNDNNTTENTATITSLGNDKKQLRKNVSTAITSVFVNQVEAGYNKKKNENIFYITANASLVDYTNNRSATDSVSDQLQKLQSVNVTAHSDDEELKRFSLKTGLSTRKSLYDETRTLRDWEIAYTLDFSNLKNRQQKNTSFTSIQDTSQNQIFNRNYIGKSDSLKHNLFFSAGDLARWIFGYKHFLKGVTLKFQNHLFIFNQTKINDVTDIIAGTFVPNTNLTAHNRFQVIDERPSLQLSKTILKNFGLRYNKNYIFTLNIQEQFNSLVNRSSQPFQNISYRYARFTPNADISYSNQQFGNYHDLYSLQYKIAADYPTIDQLAPLVDSSNLYHITQGNSRLQPTNYMQLNFNWQHTSLRPKRFWGYRVYIGAGLYSTAFADSVITDSLGRTSYYTVNGKGKKYISVTGNLNKAVMVNKNNKFQVEYLVSIRFEDMPNVINNAWNVSHLFSSLSDINIQYSYKDKLTVLLKQKHYYYRSRQQSIQNIAFINSISTSGLHMEIKPTGKFSLGSNITYTHTNSTVGSSYGFAIWNANAGYRLLPGNNLEIALAAFDLLRQNKGIINTGFNNTLTSGTVNVLQQYFMLTLSYFPRKFGK